METGFAVSHHHSKKVNYFVTLLGGQVIRKTAVFSTTPRCNNLQCILPPHESSLDAEQNKRIEQVKSFIKKFFVAYNVNNRFFLDEFSDITFFTWNLTVFS